MPDEEVDVLDNPFVAEERDAPNIVMCVGCGDAKQVEDAARDENDGDDAADARGDPRGPVR